MGATLDMLGLSILSTPLGAEIGMNGNCLLEDFAGRF